jgi:hypothetical protein
MKENKHEIGFDIVVEAMGTAQEVVLENEPDREGLIEFLTRHGEQVVARLKTDGERPEYMSGRVLQSAGFKIGSRGTLIFRTKPRPAGAPTKLTDEGVGKAIKKLKGRATQKAVADQLNVAERTLERWRLRQGLKSWKEAVERYA